MNLLNPYATTKSGILVRITDEKIPKCKLYCIDPSCKGVLVHKKCSNQLMRPHFSHFCSNGKGNTNCSGGSKESHEHHAAKLYMAKKYLDFNFCIECMSCHTILSRTKLQKDSYSKKEVKIDNKQLEKTIIPDVSIYNASTDQLVAAIEIVYKHKTTKEKELAVKSILPQYFEVSATDVLDQRARELSQKDLVCQFPHELICETCTVDKHKNSNLLMLLKAQQESSRVAKHQSIEPIYTPLSLQIDLMNSKIAATVTATATASNKTTVTDTSTAKEETPEKTRLTAESDYVGCPDCDNVVSISNLNYYKRCTECNMTRKVHPCPWCKFTKMSLRGIEEFGRCYSCYLNSKNT